MLVIGDGVLEGISGHLLYSSQPPGQRKKNAPFSRPSELLPCVNAGRGVSGRRPENRDLKVVATLERTQYKEALPPSTLNIVSPPFLDMYKLSLGRKEGS